MDQGTDCPAALATVERMIHPHERTEHARFNDADGIAALGICEALLIALTELKVISEQDARDVLTGVATARSEAADTSKKPEKHRAVAAIVQRILAGKAGVRH
jgi:hypothetical protein